MPLFGGDPRLLPIELLLEVNKWYDVITLPVIFCHQLNKFNQVDTMIVGFIWFVFELFRIFLVTSHRKSNVPIFVGYLILSFAPTFILEIVWAFILRRTGAFIKSVLIGYLIQHILQIIVGIIAYIKLSNYLNGFYEFAKVKVNSQREEHSIAIPQDESLSDN